MAWLALDAVKGERPFMGIAGTAMREKHLKNTIRVCLALQILERITGALLRPKQGQ